MWIVSRSGGAPLVKLPLKITSSRGGTATVAVADVSECTSHPITVMFCFKCVSGAHTGRAVMAIPAAAGNRFCAS
jgi:hypothetical protein